MADEFSCKRGRQPVGEAVSIYWLTYVEEWAMSVLRGVRVLVVENDDMNAMLLELQLVQAGAAVLGPVGEVSEALQLIKADAPDIAVLDYRLGNGQTSEPIARLLSELGIPFVLATGVASGSIPGGFERGVILTKPYLSEELVSALSRARQLSDANS